MFCVSIYTKLCNIFSKFVFVPPKFNQQNVSENDEILLAVLEIPGIILFHVGRMFVSCVMCVMIIW